MILTQSRLVVSKLINREVAKYGKNFMEHYSLKLRMKFFQVTLVIFSLIFPFITGCSNSSMENVVSKNLSFDLLEYFDGETTAWGLIVDRFGNLQRTFKVRLNGNIDNKQLLLKEYFTYNDGETEYREWIITKTETGTYEGKSKDTIGVAKGKQNGNTMRMVYDTTISIDETDIRVSFDDRFVKADTKVVINRAEILKWGIKIADVTIFFSK